MVWLCRISIYAWMPDSWEIIWNKFDFILFFFSALNFPLAVESGSRTIKNSRNPDELDTGCATVAQLRLPSPLKDSPCSGKWRATLCSACTLHRYEYICWYKIVESVGPKSNSLYFQAISAQPMLLREERHPLLWWPVSAQALNQWPNMKHYFIWKLWQTVRT